MAHDVFISYSLKDKQIADAACVVLETNGIRCWIAPRDIVPGRDWGGSIMEAIRGSGAMVLIFSANANTSAQIKREVERAINKGIPVIPFRIEDVAPSDTLEYFISTPHWLDAFTPPMEPHLAYLAEVARQIVGGSNVSPAEMAEREPREKAEMETTTLAEEERKAAKLAKLKLADEKKATEAAKVARLVKERRKAEQEARLEEERRRAAEAALSTGVEKPSVAERRETEAHPKVRESVKPKPQTAESAAAKSTPTISKSDLDQRAAFIGHVRKAFKEIGMTDRLWYGRAIPSEKASAATKAYAPNISQDAIMLLYDSSFWRGAKSGLLLTVDAIYWHSNFLGPSGHCLYADIQKISVKGDYDVRINDDQRLEIIGLGREIAQAVVNLIRSLKNHPA